jgi:hypothetical protein
VNRKPGGPGGAGTAEATLGGTGSPLAGARGAVVGGDADCELAQPVTRAPIRMTRVSVPARPTALTARSYLADFLWVFRADTGSATRVANLEAAV